MAATPTKKALVRVLALPGYTQNAAILSRKVRKGNVGTVEDDPLTIFLTDGIGPKNVQAGRMGYVQNTVLYKSRAGTFPAVFLDPPHILDKVDFGNGTATLADFDSESTMDQEQRTPETTPRYARQ